MPHRSHPLHLRLLERRRRLKRWLRPLPRRANVGRYPVIKWFAEAARRRPWLWSFRRREVLVSLYAGSVLALMPTYGVQLLIGFALAVWLRGNLAVMTALQMVVNPLTIVPIYAATFWLGHGLLDAAGVALAGPRGHAAALVAGGIVGGLAMAVVLDVAWRFVAWEARRFKGRWQAMKTLRRGLRTIDTVLPAGRYGAGMTAHARLLLAAALSVAFPATAATITDWPLPPKASAAQPDLSIGPDGGLLLSWIETHGAGHRLRFARHPGDTPAAAWSAVDTVAAGDDWFVNWADFPVLQALPDGSLWAHALVRNGDAAYAYDTKLFVSRDGGRHWKPLGAVHDDGTATEHGFATLWAQSDSTVGIAWLDGRRTGGGHDHDGGGAGAMTLRAATFGADGRKRGEAEIDASTCDCCQTASARTADATLLAWRDRAPGEIRDIVVARFDGKRWSEPVPVRRDGWVMPACPVNGPAIAARGERAWVAWYTAAGDLPQVRLAASADGGRHFRAMRVVAKGDAQHGRTDVAADASGIWVSWVEETAAGQSLWLARYAPDLTAEHFRTRVAAIAGRGRATGFPRMQVDGGAAWLAWTEVVDGAPRLRGAVVTP